jgi:hypothetical protein
MKQQAAMTVAPSALGEKQAVRCENPKCEFHRLTQFMTKNGRCRNRNCNWELPLNGAAWIALIPCPKSAGVAMQLALGKRLEENQEEPF